MCEKTEIEPGVADIHRAMKKMMTECDVDSTYGDMYLLAIEGISSR